MCRVIAIVFTGLLAWVVFDFTWNNWSHIQRSVTGPGYVEVQHELDVARAKDILAKEDARIAARASKRIAAQ